MRETVYSCEAAPGLIAPTIPWARFAQELPDSPLAAQPYVSTWGGIVGQTKDLAADAHAEFIAGFSTRTHAGQTAAGTISSGIRSSTLRLPERPPSSSLAAVSI